MMPPLTCFTEVPGLFTSNERKTCIIGSAFFMRAGVLIFFSMASISASMLSLCWNYRRLFCNASVDKVFDLSIIVKGFLIFSKVCFVLYKNDLLYAKDRESK